MNKMINQHLTTFGWNDYWKDAMNNSRVETANKAVEPARIVAQFSNQYRLMTNEGERTAEVSGKFEFNASGRINFPAVGDWVTVELLQGESRAVIHAILPRRTAMIRKEAGNKVDAQVIGANMDTLFIVNALNQDFNIRKIERYLVAAWESGAKPVILLTKMDLCNDPAKYIALVENVAPGVPIHAISALHNIGKEELAPYLFPGSTIAVTGSSGVGKSTLLNWFAGQDLQTVQEIREDDARGRHTTTHRELFVLPSGAVMMDTPGMRELQLWDAQDGWQATFSDIEDLAAQCRYRDCRHESELGCAVKQGLADHTLDRSRYANYKKTQKELAHLMRKEQAAQRIKKNQNKPNKGERTRNDKSAYSDY